MNLYENTTDLGEFPGFWIEGSRFEIIAIVNKVVW